MKSKIAISTVVLALILLTSGVVLSAGYQRISGAELETMMGDNAGLVIVDVREPWLYSRGHIPGAINIPYGNAHDRILKELKPEDTIVFVCHGGPMGDELGGILAKNGYTKVCNVKGGMRRWRGAIER
jgi:rhodanese-related sulfurtransferase